jgi:DNA helicase-2/ATP-dependent DNA helicase PcrA
MDTLATSADADLLAPLTAPQREAVTHVDGPLLILAGPGSGKTRVVTHRIAYLLRRGIPARNILALTFTNKAADEMKSRLAQLAPSQSVWMGTFHRFCARLLRQYASLVGLSENYSIYDVADSREILKAAIEEEGIELTHATPESIAHAISWAKNNLIGPDDYVPSRGRSIGGIVERVYPTYQKRLLAANAVDFDDLLMHVASILKENPELRQQLDEKHRYILVDEYQDTNLAQYAIVRALSIDHSNLAVTGDPDQSIYGWRGANLSNILEFEKDFPSVKVVRLEQNYRSTKAILRVADELIEHNIRRKKKHLFTDNPEGAPVRLYAYPSQRDEADHIVMLMADAIRTGRRRPRDFAVFYRINALSRQFEQALREHVIPYQIVNGLEFFQRKEIKDVLAYLHLINNPRSEAAFLRIVNTPPRGIGKSTIGRLQEHAAQRGISLVDAAREAGVALGINKKSAIAVAKFVAMFDRLCLAAHAPVEEIVGTVLAESGYREVLENSEDEEDQERLANVEELLTDAREFDMRHPGDGQLEQFLEETALVADTDAWETESDKVSLMTMHAAKGLEFPVVFIVACEQGLLPHERSMQDEEKVEEERRLLFVGITRAQEELQLSYAQYRMFRGIQAPAIPSPFLMELPRPEMELSDSATARRTTPDWEESQIPSSDEAEGDTSFDVASFDDVSQVEPESRRKKKGAAKISAVVTGADLLAEQENGRQRTPPGMFKHGMHVTHPQYGSGQIVALSGEGLKRRASVRFDDGSQRKFVLIHADLRPAED